MSKMSQREGVFNAVTNVLKETNKTIDGAVELTKDERAEVIEIVAVGIHEGDVEFSDEAKKKYSTFDDIKKKYVPGLVNNWLRKDTRLNGGDKYVPKNPGSRTGSQDDTMKNLKALRTQLTQLGDNESIAAVDAEIAKRKAELAKAKVKTITIDADKIPEALRHLIPTND